MKLFAATTEYQDIIPTTIRETQAECESSVCNLRNVQSLDEFIKNGGCIAEFEDSSSFGFAPLYVCKTSTSTVKYIAGFRSKL